MQNSKLEKEKNSNRSLKKVSERKYRSKRD